MVNHLSASEDEPVLVRVDDRITLTGDRVAGYVHSLHRDIENGRPGVRYRVPFGKCPEDRIRSAFLTDIVTVNGRRTDYALRYPIPDDRYWCSADALAVLTQPPLEQVSHALWEGSGLDVTLRRVPVPEVFDPAQEEDLCNGMVGIDVEMRFRMHVLPGEQDNSTVVRDALEFYLRRDQCPRLHAPA
ncbi:hypothetical protein OG795_32685 (plasmid) [[Kitasatospora] papulosa]|uniref:hypothetical protein n=1 Tax=[Kitasatospora] papulosa TaxID=1464011 RepID=UPI002F90D3E3